MRRGAPSTRGEAPAHLIVVTSTGTGVGKTWVACALIGALRDRGFVVAARKPVQSLDPCDEDSDAVQLARASGEDPYRVCPPHRTYRLALAPPMAAAVLGAAPVCVADLIAETTWIGGEIPDVGVVEGAGGVCSPVADDGDTRDLIAALAPSWVILVARPDLGTIHEVRAAAASLECAMHPPSRVVVFVNRWETADQLHVMNARWLSEKDGFTVATDLETLVDVVVDARSAVVPPGPPSDPDCRYSGPAERP